MTVGSLIRVACATAAIGGAVLLTPTPADAHPLDVYLQASYITVQSTGVGIEVDISPGTEVAADLVARLDTDHDGKFSDEEGRAFADVVVADLAVSVDGTSLPITIANVGLPTYKATAAGYGTVKIVATAPGPVSTGTHTVAYENRSRASKSVFQANAFLQDGLRARVGTQERDADQSTLTFPVTIEGGADGSATSPAEGEGSGTLHLVAAGAAAVALAGCAVPLRRSVERRRSSKE